MDTITLRDGKKLYYEREGEISGQHVVVFIPGVGDRPDNTWVGNSLRKYISEAMPGFSVILPGLFHWAPDARDLFDCTLQIQIQDVRALVKYLHEHGAASIHLGAHSLGAWVAMGAAHQSVNSLMLYDPSHSKTGGIIEEVEYVQALGGYVRKRGGGALFGEAFAQSVWQTDSEQMAGEVRIPTLIVNAEEGILRPGGEAYEQIIGANGVLVERHVVSGARHLFSAPQHINDLVHHTATWLRNQPVVCR